MALFGSFGASGLCGLICSFLSGFLTLFLGFRARDGIVGGYRVSRGDMILRCGTCTSFTYKGVISGLSIGCGFTTIKVFGSYGRAGGYYFTTTQEARGSSGFALFGAGICVIKYLMVARDFVCVFGLGVRCTSFFPLCSAALLVVGVTVTVDADVSRATGTKACLGSLGGVSA